MIRTYRIDTAAFYERFAPASEWNPRIEEAIRQLVQRYRLRDKHILGIASGASQEEFWLATHGDNRLTIVDIDEHGSIEPVLQTLPSGELNFHVGDALEYFAAPVADRFDAIYVSGLTPDEIRRHEILGGTRPSTLLRKIRARLFGLWPKSADPFHPILMNASRLLRPGGVLIVQSIGFGVHVLRHRQFVPAAQRQLSANGMELLEIYRWTRAPGINLFVGRAEGGPPLQLGPPITIFHGRGEPHQPAERIWPR